MQPPTVRASAFLEAVQAGVLKVMSKLGVCTLRSYIGAQTFETLGLGRDVVELCFPGMRAHVPTIGFGPLEQDIRAWSSSAAAGDAPADRGLFRFRRDGVKRGFDPNVIKFLRASAMNGDYDAFEKLSDEMEARPAIALRDLVQPQALGDPIPLDEVEPVSEIVKRFVTAAMSLGALGPEAHETIAEGVNRIGARSNSGEGGEEPSRYWGSSRSAIKQVASARFGVSAEYLASADELEIKMAQGSKPGEGGQIPGFKVSEDIARLRGASAGQALISPSTHHDIYSIEDLAELIYDLRRAAPQAQDRGQAGEPVGNRRRGQRGRESSRRHDSHQRLRRGNRRLAALLDQARRLAVGARPGRDAPRAGRQWFAFARASAGRRRI